MIESRGLAHKLFAPPTVRERWTAELGASVEFEPVLTERGLEATLREPQTSAREPGAQRIALVSLTGQVSSHEPPEGRYVARGEGAELSWVSSSRYVHDPFMPSVDNLHRDLVLRGQGWSQSLPDRTTSGAQSPYPWAPVSAHGRTVAPISEQSLACFDRDGNRVFEHQGSRWSELSLPPAIGPDGRVTVTDRRHNTLKTYRPDGATAWERTLYKNVRCTPLPLEDGGTLVALQSDVAGVTSLVRLDEQGQTVREWTIPGSAVAGLARAQDGTWLVASNDSPSLRGYDDAGELRWEHPLAQPSLGAPRELPDGTLLVVGRNGRVTALEVSDPRTSPELPGSIQGEVRQEADFVNVAGVRLRRK